MKTTEPQSMLDKIKGILRIDVPPIANGTYDLIPDDDKACLVYGMLPYKYWEPLERGIKERIAKLTDRAKALNVVIIPDDADVENAEIDRWAAKKLSDTMHEVSLTWLKRAKEEGILQA